MMKEIVLTEFPIYPTVNRRGRCPQIGTYDQELSGRPIPTKGGKSTPLQLYIFAATLTMVLPEIQRLILIGDGGTRRHRLGDKRVCTNDTVMADQRIAAQNGGIGIDGHPVFNGRMSLVSPQTLPATGRKASQGDALIYFYIISNDGCLPDDDAGAMVDKEMIADGSTGMDVNTR